MSSQENLEIKIDLNNLYREESITDLRVLSIRRMIPIKSDGTDDPGREPRFMGQTNIMSGMGPVPVQCTIEAKTLEEALGKFPDAIRKAVTDMIEEAKEMRRQEASRIVVPDGKQASALHMP